MRELFYIVLIAISLVIYARHSFITRRWSVLMVANNNEFQYRITVICPVAWKEEEVLESLETLDPGFFPGMASPLC